jgi:hypothetical protein
MPGTEETLAGDLDVHGVLEDTLETNHGPGTLPEEAGVWKKLVVADGEPVLKFGEAKAGEGQEVLRHLVLCAD